MKDPISRRSFLKTSAVASAGAAVWSGSGWAVNAQGANKKVRVAVIGCNNRGMDHVKGYLALPDTAEIACICDVDSRVVEKACDNVEKNSSKRPKGATDLRKVLDDSSIDAVSIATPDHWHTPATMLACAAGKHVYVEKPGSHNLRESEWIVASAKKHKRVVQMGNQRRSWPWVQDAIGALHNGELGKVFFARCWYTNKRVSIGHGKTAPVPEWLNWDLWQGPAPEKEYHDNYLHYSWHWFWNWGTGELGNNGVHSLDLARWGMQVDLPKRITCGGNRYHYQDDWETPDIYVTMFDFGTHGIAWEGQSCDPRGFEGAGFGINFYGEKGAMVIAGDNLAVYDLNQKLLREVKGKRDDVKHFSNFLDGIRENKPLASNIADGQRSTMLCHLGNIAWRSGHTVNFDSEKMKIVGDKDAEKFIARNYRKGWEPKV